ncbi:putative iron-sulfur-binding subunit of xanthine dehydrogenase XdhC [Clostridium sporogenes]|uniref:(2Fe-2S)-binding protein n=1 Tax=Clostridium botulinum TaxID=1491 RepID=UPI0007178818|nr:(2Fe-2S)-binding protein [Clostridium botulinum]KRU25076.1 putative iron-sulfur-binding subunit of xanthine dehydrogenase XdhC [Clostridium sporogenes]KRU31967.1 putative iron-sulfur-binding subunit of xanthine dehydrogenase XdhC [Clostridium sporogenes]KRU34237.1 putative iron-sulfur-binding subunit of xanthine dehydrogenase XdhC [Clostridium sporogenes]KRU41254.1 putative iron-sulfur-binding subunit of xanthine dehydrogenase XdhC [Clostridium sporogenes]MBZ1328163.1 (2Fe-2S)-binding prote
MISYIEETKIELDINGEKRSVIVRPADTLLRVLREKLGLTGGKPGCENGDCGACTVLLDGIPIKSCIILAVEAVGHKLITIEGLKEEPIQKAFIEKMGFQCGYCTPDFIMNCYGIIKNNPYADDETIEKWLQSNICRCTGYEEIRDAVKSVLFSNKK